MWINEISFSKLVNGLYKFKIIGYNFIFYDSDGQASPLTKVFLLVDSQLHQIQVKNWRFEDFFPKIPTIKVVDIGRK